MEFIWSFLIFCIAVVVGFYFPGLVVLRLVHAENNEDQYILAWATGICCFLLGTYITAWLHIPYLYCLILILSWVYIFFNRKKITFIPQNIPHKFTLGIIFLGTCFFTALSFFSDIPSSHGIQFMNINAVDGITHIAYIKNQLLYFPPQHPEMVGVVLKGYHYFYDFLLSRFALFFFLKPEDLFFRYFPLFISMFYGLSFLHLARKFTKNTGAQNFILFFVYFGQGLTYFVTLLSKDFSPLTAQPIDSILDPSTILATALFVVAVNIFPKMYEKLIYALLVGLYIGMLSQMKVYVGITALVTLIVYIVWKFIFKNKKHIFYVLSSLITATVLTGITFLPNNIHAGRFILAPFTFYDQFMQQKFFTFTHWGVIESIYRAHNNWRRLFLMTIESIGIYWVLNIGIRAIILLKAKSVFQKSFWLSDYTIIIFSILAITILIPSFFIQSPSPFEVMQFVWITMIFLAIPAGITYATLLKFSQVLKIALVLFVIIITMPYCVSLEYQYLFAKIPTMVFTPKQVAVLNTIPQNVGKKEYVAVLPDRLTYTTNDGHLVDTLLWNRAPIISALTGRSVYYEGNATPFLSTSVESARVAQMFALSNAMSICDTTLIKHIMQKIGSKDLVTYYPESCLSTSSAVMIQKTSDRYSYYKFY